MRRGALTGIAFAGVLAACVTTNAEPTPTTPVVHYQLILDGFDNAPSGSPCDIVGGPA